jgi:hypothetical protein
MGIAIRRIRAAGAATISRLRLVGAVALATAAAAVLATASPADAGTYVVAQCDAAEPGFADAHFDRTSGAYYEFTRGCSSSGEQRALRIDNIAPVPVAAEGRIRWSAPAGAGIVGVRADASLREDAGHRARLSFIDAAGRQAGRVATGTDEPGGFSHYSQQLDGVGRAGFAALLICAETHPCPESEQARTAIRNIRLTVKDHAAPELSASGTLLGSGWQRGSRTLSASARDAGSGLSALSVTIDGEPLPISKRPDCAARGATATAMSPCPRSAATSAALDTHEAPFHDGTNVVRVCAVDFGSGANTDCRVANALIDNTAPTAAFRPRSAADPELISADVADARSGVAGASISYRPLAGASWKTLPTRPVPGGIAGRIDSESVPAGRYVFRVVAADRAGNVGVAAADRAGKPMVLDLPLLERTSIRTRIAALGHQVPYGERPRLRGRIRTARGTAQVAGLPLVLVERFEPGSRPKLKRRRITSGSGGRIRARLSKGPSRRVVVRFAGSRRLSASRSRARKLAVIGRVRMRISRSRVRAGGLVRFKGKVGVAGVRLPAPGKVVELQVREPGQGRYRTVGQALHSSRTGKVRTSYRFGRFYRKPARFKFRFKVTRQSGWPYRAPAHSRAKRLVVIPRR